MQPIDVGGFFGVAVTRNFASQGRSAIKIKTRTALRWLCWKA